MKPLGTIATTTRETVRHPVDAGLKVVGRAFGLARGAAGVVTGAVTGGEQETPRRQRIDVDTDPLPEPRTQTPGQPPSPTERAEGIFAGEDVTTPVGTTGAGTAYNPDTAETDLQQPGTEPLMDPATTKAVASEAETLARAADPDKG